MAVNQTKISDDLKALVSAPDQSAFIFGFMAAYGLPKATITHIRQGGSRNLAKEAGHVGINSKFYFQPVDEGADIELLFEQRIAACASTKHKYRFVILTDFVRFLAWDVLTEERLDTELGELFREYGFFLPLAGLEKAILGAENPADVKAAEKMGKLFDLIKSLNELSRPEDIHALNVFLTRLLFCLFAEDTGIFNQGQFTSAIKGYTEEDGSDLAQFLRGLFAVMNSEPNSELRKTLPSHLAAFPYVNGGLFAVDEPIPALGKQGRKILLECCMMNWGDINPDIFGSMFQAVIDVEQRGNLGQHYTSYSNIMKVIQPLFLDSLRSDLEKNRKSVNGLKKLLVRLGNIKVFDPACGSGNFLIVAYKELHTLERMVIQALQQLEPQQGFSMSSLHLDRFYGIEIDDFACEIARLALWLAEHQLNKQWEQTFGYARPALPLRSSGNIVSGNSLALDWHKVCPKGIEDEVYVIGNPPFLGTLGRSDEQRADMQAVFGDTTLGNLDFVACWFWKGAHYIQHSRAELALVSTNSICQGEQVATLWPRMFALGLHIHLAYPTFTWANNARDKAAVHVVIVGLSSRSKSRQLFQQVDGEWHSSNVSNISPYLVEGSNIAVAARSTPLVSDVPPLIYGNKPTDGGHLFLTREERDELLRLEPQAARWVKKVLGATEFLNAKERWCLWLVGITDDELQLMPLVTRRIQKVAETRRKSPDKGAQKLAERPHLFRDLNNPASYILVPRVSSERRTYVPMGFFDSGTISTDLNNILPNGSRYEFGILSSLLHNDWMRLVAGRLKSDYRYTATIVYNTFPWPVASTAQRQEIERLAEEVELVREDYPGKTLAELYDPDKMPAGLLEAHRVLDNAVDKLYRDRPFKDAAERVSHLLGLYEKLTAATR
ncbi:class I SAM-dependent DNA methyltransferase [Aeromonas cavernicola]|uniref:site-specific DNA-methyltransferase (adenine-specific) n=1 Tax=Aeromonas cavernicola TaxID=1006623 RepID=A0A2H9U1H5_9GAMM|nr:DNA methyltransferase [Aeromonas cavernicola]PJG57902.1 class I SAM-dependent DNA methyltransferase [Aeromonas cavernicola]